MLVAKYYNNNDIRIEEIPKPEIGEGEILVKGDNVMKEYFKISQERYRIAFQI